MNNDRLEKLRSLLTTVNESITKQEFVTSFKAVLDFVKQIDAKNTAEFDNIKVQFKHLANSLKLANKDELDDLKAIVNNTLKDTMAEMMVECDAKMQQMDMKMSQIRDGIDGLDGKDADEMKVMEMVLAKIPPAEPNEPLDIVDKLESLKGEYRLDASAIKNLPDAKGTSWRGGGSRYLRNLADITFTDLTDGDAIVWDETTKQFINTAIAGGGVDTANSPLANEFARFTDADTIEGRTVSEVLSDLGFTASITELNYTDGVTSAIQTQLDAKQDDITGADTRILFFDGANNPAGDAGLTYNKASDTLTIAGGLAVDTNTLFVDSTNNRVGINTASPSTALQAVDTSSGTTSFKFDFLGWNGAAYTTGLALNSTDASGYYPNHIKLTNAAYGTNGTIFTANNNGIYYSSDTGSVKHIFRDVTHSVGTFSTVASEPTLSVNNTPAADKIGIAVTAHASQTASLQEWQNSSGTPLSKVKSNGDIEVPDEAYGAGWNGSLEVPTKNALYDKIETLGGGSGITRTVVTTAGSITMGATASTDYTYYVAGLHTLSLPDAAGNTNRYTVKNLHSAAITIDTAGAENIEGAANISLQPNDSVDLMSDQTNWYVH